MNVACGNCDRDRAGPGGVTVTVLPLSGWQPPQHEYAGFAAGVRTLAVAALAARGPGGGHRNRAVTSRLGVRVPGPLCRGLLAGPPLASNSLNIPASQCQCPAGPHPRAARPAGYTSLSD